MSAEPIFGTTPPDGACRVRIETRFKRRGATPVITCEVLTQEAVQSAINASESLGKYLSCLDLGARPWGVKGDLQFLGSDGGPINAPVEVEFLYYGPGESKGDAKDQALLIMVQTLRDTVLENKRFDQALLIALKDLFTAGADKNAEAAGKAIALISQAHSESIKAQAASFGESQKAANQALCEVAKQQTALTIVVEKLYAETQTLKEAFIGAVSANSAQKAPPKSTAEELKECLQTFQTLKSVASGFLDES